MAAEIKSPAEVAAHMTAKLFRELDKAQYGR
jgi:hypothetical protein